MKRARRRIRPEVTSIGEWLSWPLRHAVFTFTLWRWRRRPHRFKCPACDRTSADDGYCMGVISADERDMKRHRWYSTSAGGWPGSKTWIAERMEPIA